RVGSQLPLGSGRGALERVGRLAEVLTVAHELQLAERGRTRRGDAALYDVRTGVAVIEGANRDGVRLAFHELHQQAGELPEVGSVGVGSTALGDFAGGARDRAPGDLEQLAHVGRGLESGARQLADSALDALQEVRERRQVGEGGEPAQRLERAIAGWLAMRALPRSARASRTISSALGLEPLASRPSSRSRYSPASRAKKSDIPRGFWDSVIGLPS